MRNILVAITFFLFFSCVNSEEKQIKLIEKIEKELYNDTTLIMSKNKVNECIERYGAFVNKYPNHSKSPEYLLDAAKLTEALSNWYSAIELYDRLVDFYPESDLAPKAFFSKAFLLDEKLNQDAKAEKLYMIFIKKYPNHELTLAASQLIELLYLSDDELIDKVLKKNQDIMSQNK